MKQKLCKSLFFKISVNGYMAFATVLDQGPTINVGPDSTDWPRVQDPAMIAPYLCKQQVSDGNFAKKIFL